MAREETIQVSLVKSSVYNTTIATLRSEAKELQTAFGSIQIGNTAKALKEQAAASKAVAQATINEAKAQKEAANAEKARYQAVKELENATKAHLQAQKEAQNVATAKIKTEKEAQNAIAATARAEKAKVQALAAADKAANGATRSMRGYANAMMNTIKQIVGFAGATQSIRYALNEMKAMSDEMVTYRKVTGATAQEMEKIRAASYSTAKKYGQTPSDFLAAASEMARAGYGQNSAAMAELATKTQLVGDMTAEAASKFLLAVDAGYKFQGNIQSLTSVLDAANSVDNSFATSIEKISEGMTLVASLAGSVHVPVEQLIAALGTLTASTQRSGQEMSRGLRSIFLNVLKDTSTEIEEGVTVTEENIQSLTDALDKYGDSSVAAARKAGKLINPMQAISSLAKAWKAGKLDESTLFGISKDIAGQRYYNAFSSLIQNYEMYEAMLEKIAGSAGSAQKEVDNMLDSWTVKANQAKTAWVELVNNTISENFIKGLLDGGIAALEFAGNLENLALMAGGAYEAIRSLASGIKNLRSGNAFGGFNLGMGLLGLGISAIGAWKASYEKAIKDVQQKAAQTAQEAIAEMANTEKLADIQKQYETIMTDGLQEEQGEIEKLKTLQDQLNGLVGDQETAIDLVNGKYDIQKKKLQELSEQQIQNAKDMATISLTRAVNSFRQTDLNGWLDWGTNAEGYSKTGVPLPPSYVTDDDAETIRNAILDSTYLGFYKNDKFGYSLGIKKPEQLEEIIEFTREIKDFYTYMGTSGVGERNPTFFAALSTLWDAVENAGGENGSILDLADAVDAYNQQLEAVAESEEDAQDALETTTEAIDEQKNAAESLADAIDEATAAKSKFDDAMKTSKADAMNDYIEAFDTLKKEIEAGRVNSTAFYASARMLMGETAYNATGGSSQAVIEALNRRGESGSLLDAEKILNQTYYDELGNIIEGYGIYQLFSQTKGFDKSRLINAEGYATIPDLSQAELQEIGKSWGGLSESLITSWLSALDQHDKEGKATDEKVQAKTAEEQLGEEAVTTAEAVNTLGESAEKAAETLNELGNPDGETDISLEEIDTSKIEKSISDGIEEGFDNGTKTVAKQADKIEKETEKTSENALDSYYTIAEKMQAFIAAVEDANGNVDEAIQSLGTTWEEVASIMEQSGFDMVVDVESAKEEIQKFFENNSEKELIFGLNADPSKAISTADAAINRINRKTATIQIGAKDNTGDAGGSSGGFFGTLARVFSGIRLAKGTRSHPGGPAIVNDGSGPELIVDRGRAFIAGGGKPAMVSLSKGARVFTASETRGILTGGGAPAYEAGAVPMEGGSTKASPASISSAAQNIGSWILSTLGFKPSGVTTEAPNKDSDKNANKSSDSNANNSGNEKQIDEKAFASLKEMIDYIIGRIGEGLDEQLDILDKQIEELKLQREAAQQQNELEEKQKAVAEAQKDLETALSERTVRYLGEDGKWHWMADARNVQSAQEALQKAQEDLAEYQDEAAFNAQVEALEKQKEALQAEYDSISKAWEKIQSGVSTPTGTIDELLAAVFAGGTPQQQTGAASVRDYLIGTLLKGGRYSGNYDEALDSIAKATAGSPIMPNGTTGTLASLIATGGGLTGSVADALKGGTAGTIAGMTGAAGAGGTNINYNYFVNGMQIGSEAANNMSLSEVMRGLTVYAGQ